ncbi:uncharacterized protein STAUR_0170 [Stigmatella aurantiaca DW4/3-1]|uniref:Uncharacterized protein n=1 Tax=Stigmatella aurantiaca (strain DW4/3-1) TaxID=378806 RepID=E3FKK6_STIAD|nr:uncharacterized protein STAUR_0170 [Stigmatella aurantiaca DW4/3-1]
MLLYTGERSTEHYVPEDFMDGPWPSSFDDESCRHVGSCAADPRRSGSSHTLEDVIVDGEEVPSMDGGFCQPPGACVNGERRVDACSGDIWCCQLLPVDGPQAP